MTYLPAFIFALGVYLIYQAATARRQLLFERVMVYVLGNETAPRQRRRRLAMVVGYFSPVWEYLGSTHQSVLDRLDESGAGTVQRFRIEQLIAGMVGMLAGSALATVMSTIRPIALYHWLLLIVLGFFTAMVAWDRYLTYRANRVTARVSQQVADTAELLALSVSAGESIPAALQRVQRVAGEELGRQLGQLLEAIELGTPISRALNEAAARTHSTHLSRLLDTLAAAIERGAPLSKTLREQARDLRDESRRRLIESGGRKEIAMLFPVVFIILPITIVFALYPGLVALRL